MSVQTWQQQRGRIAALSRSRTPEDAELVEARAQFKADRLADHVRRVVATAPPLTPDQVDRIAAILRTGGASE